MLEDQGEESGSSFRIRTNDPDYHDVLLSIRSTEYVLIITSYGTAFARLTFPNLAVRYSQSGMKMRSN